MKKGFGGVFMALVWKDGFRHLVKVVHLVDSRGKQYGQLPWGQVVGLDKLE